MKRIFLFLIIFILGCEDKKTSEAGSYTVTDDLKRVVSFDSPPERIVSLAPSITEIIYALELQDKLVGVTRFCNFPPEVKNKTRVGGMIDPNYEIITSLSPDLIVMTVEGNRRESFERLKELGFKVFVLDPRNIDGIFNSILSVAKIFKVENRAEILIDSLRGELDQIRKTIENIKKPKVLLLISLNPIITAGKNTFINDIIERSGGINIAGKSEINYPIFSREEILKINPDIIILTHGIVKDIDEMLKIFPEWRSLKAVRNESVFFIDQDIISRPSPRAISAVKTLFEIIQLFSKTKEIR
jgi:iron complex transport system substrate-binding protein